MTDREHRDLPTIADAIAQYDRLAEYLAPLYAGFGFERFEAEHRKILKSCTSPVLDIGAGSGVHAAGLSELGFDVYAVEPSTGMRERGQTRFSDKSITWIDDSLPDLSRVSALNKTFGFILVNAVWMHLPPDTRHPALVKLCALLRPAAVLSVLIRLGPAPTDRPMHVVDPDEFVARANDQGLKLIIRNNRPNEAISGVSYERLCFRKP